MNDSSQSTSSLTKARLVAVDGPFQGRSFDLDKEIWRIGRHPDNELQLRQMGVSRRHCRLCFREGRWHVEDLGSMIGTIVNGLPVTSDPLTPGDSLHIGESSFLFSADPIATDAMSSVVWNEDEWAAQSTLGLDPKQDFNARISDSLHEHQRLANELRALLDLATSLPDAHSPRAVAEEALKLLATAAPCHRAAVLWHGAETEWKPLAVWKAAAGAGALEVSRELSNRAVETGTVWFQSGVQSEDSEDSERSASSRSVIVVPLRQEEEVTGLLYLEDRSPAERFDEGHLRWLDAAGALLASALVAGHRHERLQAENKRLVDAAFDARMVGESPSMKKVFNTLRKVAPSGSTVLVRGESGTGKELVARALHRNSHRADGPFVPLNCATLSAALLESELFGHEKGAFTGAVSRRAGKLEVADGGTLFLDEVGEIPIGLQARLLRVLQEREFERVGGNQSIKVDVRLVVATNRDLEKAVAEGTFREDLYYRLGVLKLSLPPLRQRGGDVDRLAEHFVTAHSTSQGRPGLRLSASAKACLAAYPWPGNVRELSNAIERAIVLAEGEWIEVEDLPEAVAEVSDLGDADPVEEPGYHRSIADAKKRLIREALAAADGNFAEAAKALKLRKTYLHRLVSNLGLSSDSE